jgi:hypothetical protein
LFGWPLGVLGCRSPPGGAGAYPLRGERTRLLLRLSLGRFRRVRSPSLFCWVLTLCRSSRLPSSATCFVWLAAFYRFVSFFSFPLFLFFIVSFCFRLRLLVWRLVFLFIVSSPPPPPPPSSVAYFVWFAAFRFVSAPPPPHPVTFTLLVRRNI